jgi:hypothetical protein
MACIGDEGDSVYSCYQRDHSGKAATCLGRTISTAKRAHPFFRRDRAPARYRVTPSWRDGQSRHAIDIQAIGKSLFHGCISRSTNPADFDAEQDRSRQAWRPSSDRQCLNA